MRDDFCVFILTHGRPGRQSTLNTLRRYGYTGKLFLVVDDEDKTGPEYEARYGEQVLFFSKEEASKKFDIGDNLRSKASVVYARNATFDLAKKVGCRYFIQLDDDYTAFWIRLKANAEYGAWALKGKIDEALSAMVDFVSTTHVLSLAMSQGGDWIGGASHGVERLRLRRKAMNSFVCDAERPFEFIGRMNDDVNTYVVHGTRGGLFLTAMQIMLVQTPTQMSPGGLTEMYLEWGTYTKSFYTVMMAPSCVKISTLGEVYDRIHHKINVRNAYPLILDERHRKTKRREAP